MPYYCALLLCIATAFCLSLLLASLSYSYFELPILSLKKLVKFGSASSGQTSRSEMIGRTVERIPQVAANEASRSSGCV